MNPLFDGRAKNGKRLAPLFERPLDEPTAMASD
jgi:hypothetical protein